MTTPLGPDEMLSRFAHDLAAWVRREARVSMTSPLFDLPARSSLGFAAMFDVAPEVIARLSPRISAGQLGAAMAQPLMRPYHIQPCLIVEGYLVHREQLLLDGGGRFADPEIARTDDERTRSVLTWFAELCAAYRTDDEPFPGEVVFTLPILDPAAVAALVQEPELSAEDARRVARAFGAIELYTLTVHGEQRDGNFHHGPYPGPGGTQLVLHELNDLRNDVLPWMEPAQGLGVDAVGAVHRYAPDVALTMDFFGTFTSAPSAAPSALAGLWQRVDGELRPLSVDELETFAARAVDATTVLFRRIAGWEPDYRIAYGAWLFANHVVPLIRLGPDPELEAFVLARAAAVAAAELPRLRGGQPPSVWGQFAKPGAEMLTGLGVVQ